VVPRQLKRGRRVPRQLKSCAVLQFFVTTASSSSIEERSKTDTGVLRCSLMRD